jgi:hypothetical protein
LQATTAGPELRHQRGSSTDKETVAETGEAREDASPQGDSRAWQRWNQVRSAMAPGEDHHIPKSMRHNRCLQGHCFKQSSIHSQHWTGSGVKVHEIHEMADADQ